MVLWDYQNLKLVKWTVLLANSIAIGVVATPATGVVAAGTGVYLIGCAF